MLFSLLKTKITDKNSNFIYLFIICASIFVYNWYVLRSEVAALCLVNQKLQSNLANLNAKCLQLDSSLNVLQSNPPLLVPVTDAVVNNTPNLDLTTLLWYGGCVFVFVLVIATTYSFYVDSSSFLDSPAGQNFIDKNSIIVTPLDLQDTKYELLTKIDYKASTVAHWIKKQDQSDICSMPLEDFISIFETSSSSAIQSSLDSNAVESALESLQYLNGLGFS